MQAYAAYGEQRYQLCKVCLLSLCNDRAITQRYNAKFSVKLCWSDVVDKLDKKRSNDLI